MLFIPFVHNVHELEKRVQGRMNQFGNPPCKTINEACQKSYGYNMLLVLDSQLFEKIVFESNVQLSYVMMTLERINVRGSITYHSMF